MIEKFRAVVSTIDEDGFSYRVMERYDKDHPPDVGHFYSMPSSYMTLAVKTGDEVILTRDGEKPRGEMWSGEVISSSEDLASTAKEVLSLKLLLQFRRKELRTKWRKRVRELK